MQMLATKHQLDAIERLRYVRMTDEMGPTPDPCSYADADMAIAWAQRQPRRPETIIQGTRDSLEPGVYTNGLDIYRVKLSHRGYLIVYSLTLVPVDENEPWGKQELSTRYAGGAYATLDRIVREFMLLTIDQAEDLSLQIGNCIFCGKTLRAAKSVRVGIGPVCRKRFSTVTINAMKNGVQS